MLAHKASHEGKLAAEVAHGEKRAFDARVIPSVAYTDPEIAWVGLTETDAKAKGMAYEKATFPWSASGRSLSLGRDDGMTKLLFDPATHRVIGGGIVGPNAGDLICRSGARHRDGQRRCRHRPDHPSASDVIRNRHVRRRGVRGHADRSVRAEKEVKDVESAGSRTTINGETCRGLQQADRTRQGHSADAQDRMAGDRRRAGHGRGSLQGLHHLARGDSAAGRVPRHRALLGESRADAAASSPTRCRWRWCSSSR